jgi:hypothetical protein
MQKHFLSKKKLELECVSTSLADQNKVQQPLGGCASKNKGSPVPSTRTPTCQHLRELTRIKAGLQNWLAKTASRHDFGTSLRRHST